jgi:hypothetical protein
VTARGIDERAEVGLLSRNIVVEGEEGRGGCVMIMGEGAGAGLSGAEFRYLGVLGEKGKYPVHFHRVGNGTGSFVRDCAIHDGYNRWLTIHGTRHVVAKNNVGFETIGHGYFLEDGDETNNVLENNLGVGVRSPPPGKAVTPGDVRPAVFWVSNPDNVLRGNVAAGSPTTASGTICRSIRQARRQTAHFAPAGPRWECSTETRRIRVTTTDCSSTTRRTRPASPAPDVRPGRTRVFSWLLCLQMSSKRRLGARVASVPDWRDVG